MSLRESKVTILERTRKERKRNWRIVRKIRKMLLKTFQELVGSASRLISRAEFPRWRAVSYVVGMNIVWIHHFLRLVEFCRQYVNVICEYTVTSMLNRRLSGSSLCLLVSLAGRLRISRWRRRKRSGNLRCRGRGPTSRIRGLWWVRLLSSLLRRTKDLNQIMLLKNHSIFLSEKQVSTIVLLGTCILFKLFIPFHMMMDLRLWECNFVKEHHFPWPFLTSFSRNNDASWQQRDGGEGAGVAVSMIP